MPWSVKREGSVLEVQISMPRGQLGHAVRRRATAPRQRPPRSHRAKHLAGAPPIDRVLLKRFRDELTVSGVDLIEPAFV